MSTGFPSKILFLSPQNSGGKKYIFPSVFVNLSSLFITAAILKSVNLQFPSESIRTLLVFMSRWITFLECT